MTSLKAAQLTADSNNADKVVFLSKFGSNLEQLNRGFTYIASLFDASGVKDFEQLPADKASRGEFAKPFRQLNTYLESAVIQGFTWKKAEYDVQLPDGSTRHIEALLRDMTGRGAGSINEFGMLSKLEESVDLQAAKAYFERIENRSVPAFRISAKVDGLLRRFITSGGFDI